MRICTTGEVMANIVFGEDNEKKRNLVLEFIKDRFPQITTIVYTVNTKWNDSIFDLEPVTYTGKGYVLERLEDFQFKIGPKSFFQTNTKQGEKLYRITREFAELSGEAFSRRCRWCRDVPLFLSLYYCFLRAPLPRSDRPRRRPCCVRAGCSGRL